MRFLKKLLVMMYAFLGVYTLTALIVFAITKEEPEVLNGCVFTAIGAESITSCVIKCSENRKDDLKERKEEAEKIND